MDNMTPLERANAAVMKAVGDESGAREYMRAQELVRVALKALGEASPIMCEVGANWLIGDVGNLETKAGDVFR
jgi:hypothetical protein